MVKAANGELLLEKRPQTGIWGGLWCFPEIESVELASRHCLDRWGLKPVNTSSWDVFRHTFSHYHLDIQPVQVDLPSTPETVMEADQQLWYNVHRPPEIGLAAPIVSLLEQLK